MRTLKKVICLIGILLFSLSSYTYAQMVQISDTGAYQLFTTINQINNQFKDIDCPVTDFTHVGILNQNSPYDIYTCLAGPYGHGVVISFFCNKAGYVSKIVMVNKFNDKEAVSVSAKSIVLLSLSLGLSNDECGVLGSRERLLAQLHTDVWVAKINRRIVLEFIPDLPNNLLVSRLTAYDN